MNKSKMVAGIFGVLIGMGFICPAIAELRLQGVLPAQGVALLLLGVLLLTAGGGAAIRAVRLRNG
jgi:hypothetical protein